MDDNINALVDSLRLQIPKSSLKKFADRFSFADGDPLSELGRPYRTQGYLTRDQADRIVQWKVGQRDAGRFCKENEDKDVRSSTNLAILAASHFTDNPERAANCLINLKRVHYPVASAILTALNPDEFGIIDKRVWSALYKLTGMKKFDRGKRTLFKPDEFHLYICILRRWRDIEGVSPRLIDKALWQFDKENPKALYRDGMKGITFTDHQYIVRKEGILSREPVVNGTRTPVRAIVGNSRLGYTPKKILEALPHLSLKAIHDALSYYNHHTEEIEEHIEQNRVPEHLIHPSVRGL